MSTTFGKPEQGIVISKSLFDEMRHRIKDLEAALAEPEQELDPALHFCHRFAILLECMVHADASNTFWEEAHTLLDEYYKAQAWWRQKMGEPYVSGFGKD